MQSHRVGGFELAGLGGAAQSASGADPWRLPTRIMIDEPWRSEAACRSLPTAWWYVTRGDRAPRAKAICAACPVKAECLEAAMAEDGSGAFGVRGGMSARERNQLRRQRRRAGG